MATKDGGRTAVERFFHASLLVVAGVAALDFAVQLLAGIWVWLVVIGVLVAAAVAAVAIWRHKRHRW